MNSCGNELVETLKNQIKLLRKNLVILNLIKIQIDKIQEFHPNKIVLRVLYLHKYSDFDVQILL